MQIIDTSKFKPGMVHLATAATTTLISRGAPDLEFSNPTGTGFTGFGQKFRRKFQPDLKQDILG